MMVEMVGNIYEEECFLLKDMSGVFFHVNDEMKNVNYSHSKPYVKPTDNSFNFLLFSFPG